MAQSGYTPILIYASGTTGNTPLAANLTSTSTGAELALNYFDGKLFYKDASGNVQVLASKAGNINVSSLSFGTTGLTPNTATTGAITVAGTLITSNGGTGLTTYTAGDLPYYASGTALSKLGIGTSGYILSSSGTAPQWVNSISIGSGTFTSVTDSGLTAGRVTYSGTVGLLQDSANMTFNGTTLTLANDASISGLTVGKGGGALAQNNAFGSGALNANTSGNYNTGGGYTALYQNTTGSFSSAVGYGALFANTTGNSNSAFGFQALQANTTGGSNTAVGYQALDSNTTASNNTAVGYQASYSGTTGYNNTAVGNQSLYSVTTGYNNTAVGALALNKHTSDINNTAVGYASMYNNTTGGSNSSFGSSAFYANTTGNYNVALGSQALYSNTTASQNTAVGYQAGYSNTTGASNTLIGYQTGYAVTTGANNTLIGYQAGTDAVANISTTSNNIVMGNNSNTNAYIKIAWTVTSDSRDKTNVTPIGLGLDFVSKLNPVSYQFTNNRDEKLPVGDVKYGFLAQDILELEGNNPVIIDNKDKENLKYNGESLVPILVKAIQELKAEFDAYKATHP